MREHEIKSALKAKRIASIVLAAFAMASVICALVGYYEIGVVIACVMWRISSEIDWEAV